VQFVYAELLSRKSEPTVRFFLHGDGMIRFLQSKNNFPLMISLGQKTPSWELNRWGRDSLRFVPFNGGAYKLRGDKWNMHYTGELQSHRFTILDGDHFEYDIMLNREPESNRLYLAIDGWESFDFFRQPDTFGPEHLRGSYAVYKKEGVINAAAYHVGTGKICHIHRPKIIDARGRWVWGDIWIDQGVMTLTIPEAWLGNATYPVVVDPVIGSSVVGAYESFAYLPAYYYAMYLQEKTWNPNITVEDYTADEYVWLYDSLAVNKYTLPIALDGAYTMRVYLGAGDNSSYRAAPLIYSDYNNKPKQLLSTDGTYATPANGTPGLNNHEARWITSTVTTNTIAENTDIWLGFLGLYSKLQFDYGTPLFQDIGINLKLSDFQNKTYAELLQSKGLLNIESHLDMYLDPNSEWINTLTDSRYDLKISMYIEAPTTYTRTITQGVTLADGGPLRSLGIYLKLTTVGFVRDFILKRFLKSNEEIVLKSPVCREIEIDSRIH
jgi:hypothetical protein